jgi:hypothetical protein
MSEITLANVTANFKNPRKPNDEPFHIVVALFKTGDEVHTKELKQVQTAMDFLAEHKLVQFHIDNQQMSITGLPGESFILGNTPQDKLNGNIHKILYCCAVNMFLLNSSCSDDKT